MFLAAMLMIVAPDGRLRAESGNPARHRPTIAPYAEPRQESNSLVADVLLGLIAEMQMSGLATRRSRLDIVRIKLHCIQAASDRAISGRLRRRAISAPPRCACATAPLV